MLAAVMSSVLTISAFQYFKIGHSDKLVVEHRSTSPVLGIGYGEDENGNIVPLDFTETSKNVSEAVVHITNTQTSQRRQDQTMDLFDFFQGPMQPRGPQARVGFGSGVIISEDGYIVTNNHVIADADDIEVRLSDQRTFKAKLVGTDPTTDIALVKIREQDLPYLKFSNSDYVQVGEWVLAVGNPFNFYSTVTAGIVSAKARSIRIIPEQYAIESFIQTDAAINKGNSGGALVNLAGDLIGINTAIASPTGSYSGYGFAVPSNIVSKVVEDLSEYGYVKRGVIGVMIGTVDGNIQKQRDLDVYEGALVDSVLQNSAAMDAGLLKNDVIVAIDGNEVKTSSQLTARLGLKRPGEKVEVTVNRFGEEKQFTVALKDANGDRPETTVAASKPMQKLGADLQPVDKEVARKLDIEGGVKVTSLGPGKLRRDTNMREGFIITSINGDKVSSVKDVEKILQDETGGIMLEGVYEDIPGVYYYAFGLNQ